MKIKEGDIVYLRNRPKNFKHLYNRPLVVSLIWEGSVKGAVSFTPAGYFVNIKMSKVTKKPPNFFLLICRIFKITW